MGLFGSRKTLEEIFEEGKERYERGEYAQAILLFFKITRKLPAESDYWAGKSFLALFDEKGKESDLKKAKNFLSFAAEK